MNGRTVLAAFIIALAALPVGAQETEEPEGWVCGGPWGGLVFSLDTDPSVPGRVLARTVGGAFVEDDGRWRKVGRPGAVPWEKIALAHGRYWCKSEKRFFSSADGDVWRAEGEFPSGFPVSDFLAPEPERILAAGAGTFGKRSAMLRILERRSGTWSVIKYLSVHYPRQDYLKVYYSAVLVHPADPLEMLYFVQLQLYEDDPMRSHFLRSRDGGKSWASLTVDYAVNAVAWNPEDPSMLFALHLDWVPELSRLLRSDDGGKSFRPIGDDPRLAELRTIAIAPDGKGLLLGSRRRGLLRSDFDGGNIAEAGGGLPKAHVTSIAVDPEEPGIVIAGTQVGVWRSEGGAFRRTSEGLAGIQAVGLVSLADGRLGCFGYHEGLRISTDGGRTWGPRPSRMAHRMNRTMTFGPSVLVVSRPHDRVLDRVTLDRGRTWMPVRVEGEPVGIGPGEVYARGRDGRLLVSRDGTRWETLDGSVPETCAVCRPQPDGPILLAAGDEGEVVYLDGRTADRTATVPLPENVRIWTFFMPDPLLENVVYLFGHDGAAYRLDVSARKLVEVCRREGAIFGGLAADPARPGRRYLAFGDGHFVVSDDAGRTWRPLKAVPRFHEVRAMAVSAGRLAVAADGAVHSIALTELR